MPKTSYDDVPYPSYSYAQSHPDRLATLATVFGMKPAPLSRCRVLELGCAGGGNLIPMAYGLPGSEFVGIDLSARQIAEGHKMVAALGLKNIALKAMDIQDVGPDLGQFDYIIAHGVYSWVPEPVRDKLLAICRQNMSPQGVAYISYNTYPGWHMLGMMREMMLYHTRNLSEPVERAQQARQLLEFLAQAVPNTKKMYGGLLKFYADFLKGKLDNMQTRRDAAFLHDELEAVNEPLYFHQFVRHAARHGLQFLSEVEFWLTPPGEVGEQISGVIDHWAQDVIEAEQYLDFLHNRTFRQTLLCRQEVVVSRRLKPACLASLYLAGRARPLSEQPDLGSKEIEQFRRPERKGRPGMMFSTDHPLTKAALVHLAAIWPRTVPFAELVRGARDRLAANGRSKAETAADEVQLLAANLLACYVQALVALHTHAPHFALQVSERPLASPVARSLARRPGAEITNLRHERISLDKFDRYLLDHLDGEHDQAALVAAFLNGPVAEGALTLKDDDGSPGDVAQIKETLEQDLTVRLRWLAQAGLLVS